MRRFRAIKKALYSMYPGQPKGNLVRHIITLAAMISGIIAGKSANLPDIAENVVDETQNESRTKKYTRFIQNEDIDCEIYFLPFIQILITSLAALGLPFALVIDGSVVGRGCMCLMISVLYKNRALPLVWSVVQQKKGHLTEQMHLELLGEVYRLIPENTEVIVLGDGEFDGVDWLAEINGYGWEYACRTASDSILSEDGESFNFKRLGVGDEKYFSMPEVYFTHKEYGPLQAVVWWEKRYKAPIYLITNMELAQEACFWYRKRYHIETFFSDQKSRGFNIHKSHLSDPKKLKRLLIAAALAYIWIVYLGMMAITEKWYHKIHRSTRCDLSLFQLGLRLLNHLLNHSLPIPVEFKVLKFDDPFIKKSVR